MRWGIVELVNGSVRIDDFDEDQPMMTFHGTRAEARRHAELVMRGLEALGLAIDMGLVPRWPDSVPPEGR